MGSVTLVPSDPQWPVHAADMAVRLSVLLDGLAPEIVHIGSTAVPGLDARPNIDLDILLARSRIAAAESRLVAAGFVSHGDPRAGDLRALTGTLGLACRLSLMTPDNPVHAARVRFRGRLCADASLAARYARLKRRLVRLHPEDVDAYTDGKSRFVRCASRPGAFPPR